MATRISSIIMVFQAEHIFNPSVDFLSMELLRMIEIHE